MTDAQYEAKFQEMQKYIPFLQKVIDKLKVNNVQEGDNPRKAQLQKMEMLQDLLTNKAKNKKLKMETLMKCEGVLIKLHAKTEKNEDSILNNVKLRAIDNPSTSKIPGKERDVEDISGPASPPPENRPNEEDQPVVIPTERRCSPVMITEKSTNFQTKPQQNLSRQNQDHRHHHHHHGGGPQQQHYSEKHKSDEHFQNIRKKVFPTHQHGQRDSVGGSKHNITNERHAHNQHHHQHHQNSSKDIRNTNNIQRNQKDYNSPTQHSPMPIVGQHLSASPAAAQRLQTVKVVITEPLPKHIKQQHFASYRHQATTPNFNPRETICHSNLKILPQTSQHNRIEPAREVNEAYSPEELWEEYNESNGPNKNTNTVFSRLGDRVPEKTTPISIPGRYTPIPDVLKSPPLTANDINNLLLESRVDKSSKNVSEVGSRRAQKLDDKPEQRIDAPTNSLDFLRRKLAHITKLSSPKSETPASPSMERQSIEKEAKISSPLPNERVALKFNPHPRQERLLSISSNDGSECSNQSRINDPRLKSKIHPTNPLQKPDYIPNPNVNVLPSINFKDPRLKLQGTVPPLLPATSGSTLLTTYNQATAMASSNPTPSLYGTRKDPRISRVPPTQPSTFPAAPTRRLSTTQPQYSSEENWDSEPDETTPRAKTRNEEVPIIHGIHNRVQTTRIEEIPISSRIDPRLTPNQKLTRSEKRAMKKRAQDQPKPIVDLVKPRPPNSGSEENWDSEPEVIASNIKPVTKCDDPAEVHLSINSLPKPQFKTTNTCGKIQNQLKNLISPKINSQSDTEEDWDLEPEVAKDAPVTNKPTATKEVPQQFALNKSPSPIIPQLISPGQNRISPTHFANPKQRFSYTNVIIPPHNKSPYSFVKLPHPLAAPHLHTNYYTSQAQHSADNNRFSAALNDNSERIKYYEAKKQKAPTPSTYKAFREAREKAQAQEASLKRTAQIDEAKKRAEAEKLLKQKEVMSDHKIKQPELETHQKTSESTTQKKQPHKSTAPVKINHLKKDNTKFAAAESTLDTMYRTQNFNSKFPKASTTFKIPKKKTEGKPQEDTKKTNDLEKSTTDKINLKQIPNISQNQTTEKQDKPQKKPDNETSLSQQTNANVTTNKLEILEGKLTAGQNIIQTKNITKGIGRKPENLHTVPQLTKKKETQSEDKKTEEVTLSRTEQTPEDRSSSEISKSSRDPRCRPKTNTNKDNDNDNAPEFSDIIITSSESEVTLKPQTNKESEKTISLEDKNKAALDKFNKATQEMSPKPQRILRRRNTMVLFGSAPLVDKEKLLSANALLFEDVQEQEKRKRKQEEEDRQNARRNKHLEEMFQRTDDNCTVSTQNIITGKRRTRTTINFNETIVAMNVFKHISKKESLTGNTRSNTTTPPPSSAAAAAQTSKTTRNSSKAKTKSADNKSKPTDTEDEHDEENRTEEIKKYSNKNIETKPSKGNTETKVVNTNVKNENTKDKEDLEASIKSGKKKAVANRKSTKDPKTIAAAAIQDDEHQNCAVSSTSAEAPSEDQPKASSSKSYKIEPDDNEPTSTANKLNNPPTPTPEASIDVLNDIVQQIIKPNADRQHILGLLGQILSEDRLQFIKTIIENITKQQTDNDTETKLKDQLDESNKSLGKIEHNEDEEPEEEDEEEDIKQSSSKTAEIQVKAKTQVIKKKRSELDRLNEDIRDMFICEGVLTATGRRMCTIMGQTNNTNDTEASNKKSPKETSPIETTVAKRKIAKPNAEKLISASKSIPLRRSLRSCRTNEEGGEHDETTEISSLKSSTESNDDLNSAIDSNTTDSTSRRKMPLLKPNTPIKLSEEENPTKEASKEKTPIVIKRKQGNNKPCPKSKKPKNVQVIEDDTTRENSETESEIEAIIEMQEQANNETSSLKIRNTNIHWHNQSKYINWCVICAKRIPGKTSAFHYNSHHGENYISRLAPVLLQKFKQGKLNQPLFGIDKSPKQASWFFRCPFCLQYLNTTMPLWLEHLQNHTAEFRYECSRCHRGSNKALIIRKHISSQCKGATMIHSVVKLTVPTLIKAHVCHLCNFMQLKRANLERHYLEQHQLDRKNVDLLGYTITLFDVENVNCVPEDKAAEKEDEVRMVIETEEQVIDILDDDEENTEVTGNEKSEVNEKLKLAIQKEKTVVTEEETTENITKSKEDKQIFVNVKKEKMVQQKETTAKVSENQKVNRLQEVAVVTKIQELNGDIPQEVQNDKDSVITNTQNENNEAEKEPTTSTKTSNNETDKALEVFNSPKTCSVVAVDIRMEQTKSTNDNMGEKKQLVENFQIEKEVPAAKPIHEQTTSTEQVIKGKQKAKNVREEKCHIETEIPTIDLLIIEDVEVQDIQNELLVLAAQAAQQEEQTNQEFLKKNKNETEPEPEPQIVEDDIAKTHSELLAMASKATQEQRILLTKPTENKKTPVEAIKPTPILTTSTSCPDQNTFAQNSHTTISELISSSIDSIYKRSKRKSTEVDTTAEAKKSCMSNQSTTSNVFMSTRDENNFSPTIQILAQSIINIEEQAKQSESPTDKPVTISMAERLSQRFKGLQDRANAQQKAITATEPQQQNKPRENPFEKLFNDTVLELEKEKDKIEATTQKETPQSSNTNDITVISDDEDWEDIEITESAPTTTSTSSTSGNLQKSKNKGLFQKFAMYKGNNTKSKKHIPPLVFLPTKKKTKEKSSQPNTTSSSPTPSIKSTTSSSEKSHATTTNANANINLGFKPVINIMDDLLPDSPCNDPIDLVPELTPFEPLQDLNDVSSILNSNLSVIEAVASINAEDHHTSMEDALDFISEQQAQDKQISINDLVSQQNPSKVITNNITHVGYSVQSSGTNAFKFYCLLENCSFLYSSDALGLENHFMCEHSHIKWNGYCLICQTQCLPNADASVEHSITKEIKHMLDRHANITQLDMHTESTQHSTTSSHESEDRPKIKLRRLTGDCLSTANSDNSTSIDLPSAVATNSSLPVSMLGALLNAKPKPPTKDMPPQPQMPLTEPLLLDKGDVGPSTSTQFKNVSQDFLITSVTSAAVQKNDSPLQISSIISLKQQPSVTVAAPAPAPVSATSPIPKITNVRTLGSKVGSPWSQQIVDERQELMDSAAESLEVSQILANAGRPSTSREPVRALDDSPGPVLVAETVPVAQAKTGDYVITQTISAQYNENSSAAVGFNISIASSTAPSSTLCQESIPTDVSTPITSRQYKCMASSCKFVSRVPVAMSDHLRFHERRNLSTNRDYLACAFCSYLASSVDDYMKHADQYHIINKGGIATTTGSNESIDTASSLNKKIHDILNSNKTMSPNSRSVEGSTQKPKLPEQDSEEVYLRKLRQTIEEIVETTGLPDDKLYRCVVKNCPTKLTEAKFLSHIMFHIGSEGGNPNNYNFKCPHCSAQYHRVAGIKAHIKNHSVNRFFCYLCQQTSTSPAQLLKHFSEKHWHTLSMFTKVLLKPKISNDGSDEILDSGFFVAYTQKLSDEDVKKFSEKLILEWQRKKSGSKTHFKSTEIDLLPLVAIFQREVNCGECEYKTKVRTNMMRHLLMHKQNSGLANNSGQTKVASVDPVNPVPCLNSTERFFDKMANLSSSSLIPSLTASAQTSLKANFVMGYSFVMNTKRFTCGCPNCSFIAISEDVFRQHLSIIHSDNMSFRCTFCQEEVCKKGLVIDRILNHLRFHGAIIHRCEECNYLHHMRYVVERHINEKHATLKVNLVTHERSSEDNSEGLTSTITFTGKKYKDSLDSNQQLQSASTSSTTTRSSNSESYVTKSNSSNVAKRKGKWICEVCGHKSSTLGQIQTHSQQQHGSKNQYKCAHCNFGSQQLSQILFHIDEKHSGKTREARCMYRRAINANDDVADTRPLWQRNDPTRVRHIRGILMEDEEESEEYRKKLGLSDDINDDVDNDDEPEEVDVTNKDYILGYEFSCFHCEFKTQNFNTLKTQHYQSVHNSVQETAISFRYQLHRRLCCAICRQFMGNFMELKKHLICVHNDNRYYAADITIAENDDSSHRLLCGYCSFHCATVEQLHKHSLRVQHLQQDLRIDNNEHIMDILKLGNSETSYQCTLCTDIFPNSVAIVQHACNAHTGEDSFSFRELSNSLIYRCFQCIFTSTTEKDVLRHMIDHYSRFKKCHFCPDRQISFVAYMQHCYAEHRNGIRKFRELYPIADLQKFLLNILIVFPNGLMLSKTHLLNTKYGKTLAIDELYEEIFNISQQPPIPRLLIGRLVARKSIEAQQKNRSTSTSPQTLQTEVELLKPLPTQAKGISRRRSTVAVSQDDYATMASNPKHNLMQKPKKIAQRRQTVTLEHANISFANAAGIENTEFNAPVMQPKKISKRRRTVAVDFDTPSHSCSTSPYSLLIEKELSSKKRKTSSSSTPTSPAYPSNLDVEPFSYYGKTPDPIDITKIYTKVVIAGTKTPLTIDKLKNLFNIDCQLKLTKCDQVQVLAYKDYKHIIKACPASHKLRYN